MYTGSWHENTYVVTGSSGSGKSEVSRILSELGAKVISADELARAALAPGSKALKEVRATFGDKIFNGEVLNRKALGELIFDNAALREKLEELTHPVIGELAEEAFSKLSKTGTQLLVYDCPLYFESRLREKKFKSVILVTAADDVKIARLIARDGLSPETAKKRLQNQLSDTVRIPLADFVIENNGSLEDLKNKTQELHNRLMS